MATLWSKAKATSSRELNVGVVKRTMSTRQQSAVSFEKLQNELNEATVKHAEAVYWLQLELDTTRRAKEASEDRMAELYRDVQELQDVQPQKKSRPVIPDAEYVEQQNKQIEKYERMLQIMNNQIALVRSSSDTLVKSLKDKISDMMDDKVRTELNLMNKLSALDQEKRQLEQKLVASERADASRTKNETSPPSSPNRGDKRTKNETSPPSSPNRGNTVRPPQPPRRHESIDENDDETTNLLHEDLNRLRAENEMLKQQMVVAPGNDEQVDALKETIQHLSVQNKRLESELASERNKARERLVQWTGEKVSLEDEVEALRRREINVSEERVQWIQEAQVAAIASLDRVALLWDRADESIQSLEGAMVEIQSSHNHHQDAERLLSVQQTATLVHGQIKVSLMLIELKLRNSLACLENDQSSSVHGQMVDTESNNLRKEFENIQTKAMDAIADVDALVEEQIERLRSQSIEESSTLHEMHESKFVDLRQLLNRQEQLEGELTRIQNAGDRAGSNTIDMYVSQEALETLQNEVLQVVERVKEKNETIGRLTAEIEEHKVRERTLMEELKRHMNDQADRQLLEQQRIMQQNAQFENSDDCSSENGSSEYEEKTVEDTIYDETTIYEDETVL
jgi:hypothetical protein